MHHKFSGIRITFKQTNVRAGAAGADLGGTAQCALLADLIKSLDWSSRKATRKGGVSADELSDVRAKILTLIA